MKLYYTPNACSLGIHFLLEEIGQPFELEKVDMANGAQHRSPFKDMNPKSKVPVLELDDGSLITEFPAIAYYLAGTVPGKQLFPADTKSQAKVLEILDYLISTVHMRGFTRIFRPGNFAPNEADAETVRAAGREFVKTGFAVLEPELGTKDFIAGDFSIADTALFFLEFWARTRAKLAMPAVFEAHLDRMLARPAAQRALSTEGLA
jgi:glutathione S-transferase